MVKRDSRIGAIDNEFRKVILPIFLSWGLQKHPRSAADFGRDRYGYHYEFADWRDARNVRLVQFVIFSRDSSLIARGVKGIAVESLSGEIPPMIGNEPEACTLSRPFSLQRLFSWQHFLDFAFRLDQRKRETVEAAAARLIDDVVKELPRMKHYLYG